MMEEISVLELKGKTVSNITGLNIGSEEVFFYCESGDVYKMYYDEDYGRVEIEDIYGDIENLIGEEIQIAEEVTHEDKGPGEDSYTWTFYKFATIKGWVDIRWYGQSNGYYSQDVSFELMEEVL